MMIHGGKRVCPASPVLKVEYYDGLSGYCAEDTECQCLTSEDFKVLKKLKLFKVFEHLRS